MTWPADLVVVVDTREQLPFDFGPGVPTEVRGLPTGDYSVAGFEDRIALERKSLSDLLGCVGQGRDRFTRALERLARLDYPALVLECPLRAVAGGDPNQRSHVHPRAAIGSLIAWATRLRIPVWPARTRSEAAGLALDFLRHAAVACLEPNRRPTWRTLTTNGR